MSHEVVVPLPRVVPPSGTTIGRLDIPEGVTRPISYRSLFPSFEPGSKNLDRWLVPFSRGPRHIHPKMPIPSYSSLAYCELHTAFSAVFRRFDICTKLHKFSFSFSEVCGGGGELHTDRGDRERERELQHREYAGESISYPSTTQVTMFGPF